VKDTLYKFWVLKVKLRDRGSGSANNTNIIGGQTGVLRGGRTFDQVPEGMKISAYQYN
jgi:hypothetical protein